MALPECALSRDPKAQSRIRDPGRSEIHQTEVGISYDVSICRVCEDEYLRAAARLVNSLLDLGNNDLSLSLSLPLSLEPHIQGLVRMVPTEYDVFRRPDRVLGRTLGQAKET